MIVRSAMDLFWLSMNWGNKEATDARRIGLVGAGALVVANMIGTGIFTTTGFLLADLPSRGAILLAWVVGGLIALSGAVCYGALAKKLPESGGEYLFLSRTIHPAAGYIGGWVSLLVGFSAPIAAAAYAVGEYAKFWLPDALDPKWTSTMALLFFAALNGLSVRPAVTLQNIIVAFKFGLLIAFIGIGAGSIDSAPAPMTGESTVGAFFSSLVWIYFAYSGWNAAVYIGGEISSPDRNIPRSMVLGTGIVVALYVLLNAVFLYAAPASALAGNMEVARIAAQEIGGTPFAEFTTFVILVALLTSISAMIMAGPRVYAKMADDGVLPKWFSSDVPPASNSVILQLALALVMLWVPSFPDLAKYIGFTLGLGTALTVVGLVRLKLKEGLHIPGWPVIPGFFLIAILGVSVFSILREPVASLWGLASIGIGWVAWRLQCGRPNRSE